MTFLTCLVFKYLFSLNFNLLQITCQITYNTILLHITVSEVTIASLQYYSKTNRLYTPGSILINLKTKRKITYAYA